MTSSGLYPKTDSTPRTVLTKGISGIGKTFSVQKFIFDWAEGKANQDVDFMLLLPFWELDLIKDDKYNLHVLLCRFYPELEDLNLKMYKECKVVFILDGLDENREFFKSEKLYDKGMKSSVGELISDLINGKLLPSAHIWITTRPAAAKDTTTQHFDRVTEIQGFNDLQIEEHFRKRISDQDQANEIILHIKSFRSLYVMCHIPFFCHITATVFEKMIGNPVSGELPKTLTEIYSCFVLNKAEDINEARPVKLSHSDEQTIVALGELAFNHLRDNAVIAEKMLLHYGIAISEEAKHSQVLKFVLREEKPMIADLNCYRFLHSGVQQFLAALYFLNSYTCLGIPKFHPVQDSQLPHDRTSADTLNTEEFDVNPQQQNTLHDMFRVALDNALKSHDGHLDLFLRFLLGLSLYYSQNSLSQLIGASEHSEENIQKTIRYIKYIIRNKKKSFPHPQCINLLHCLAELRDYSFEEEMQKLLSSSNSAEDQLSIAQCSVLAHLVQVSGAVHEELNVGKLCSIPAGQERLISVLQYFKKVLLVKCWIISTTLDTLISALKSPDSHLIELDLSHNNFTGAQLTSLCCALRSSRLQSLNLSHVNLSIIPQMGEFHWLNFMSGDIQPLCNDFLDSIKRTTTGVSHTILIYTPWSSAEW
ncbi:NLR family CARD domain-containing protein 3-like [Colossoma macropomum]|uniref:NLR family CARD domain-containing protein 3-like n=1 Tax=Colossoma macropomum TaxID=42526 RepID=UPI0018653956|nr:NLR family CARD domain-containing protein 3-like [Colossoma macropomum]XP_036412837.1 NLR family CARD domain-containing protein 3-like [Colossoma macropomum]XP_036412839.1 NLR family CARD domain-containing protein 3-like [Colossoma macropomum]